uniref:Uncharacterized protein n=1 Tax=viral metagenome TaxID=1070528 RepID=A0A6C0DG66_9ZZZZ
MSKKGLLYYIQDHAFNIFIILSWISVITLSLGFTIINPEYISIMSYYIKIYICLYLMYRFNRFRKVEFTELDRKIVFSAAVFIFTTTALDKYLMNNLSPIESRLRTLFGLETTTS